MGEVLVLLSPLVILIILFQVVDALFSGLVWLGQTIVEAVREF